MLYYDSGLWLVSNFHNLEFYFQFVFLVAQICVQHSPALTLWNTSAELAAQDRAPAYRQPGIKIIQVFLYLEV